MVDITQINPLELLQTVFPELGRRDVQALLDAATPHFYPSETYLCREGDPDSHLFVMIEGQADVTVSANHQTEILVDTIGPNTYFGEMAFLGATTRTATIRARTDCYALVIDHTDFLPIAQTNPALLRNLLKQIIGHLRRNDMAVIQELNAKNNALEKAYADFAAQESLRTQFIATLSHELRTPLTAVKGFMDLINHKAISGDSLQVALDSITRNVDTMVGLTNDLLILYEMHPTPPEYTYVSLPDILIEALNAARQSFADQKVGVTLDIAPEISLVYSDRRALVLAIRALIENSFKFNPEHNPIQIRAYCPSPDEVAISIIDEGIGIAPENLERIFEAFVRVENDGGHYLFPGLGVGLTIAKFVVERQNGRIEAASFPGSGSTFTIILPQPS